MQLITVFPILLAATALAAPQIIDSDNSHLVNRRQPVPSPNSTDVAVDSGDLDLNFAKRDCTFADSVAGGIACDWFSIVLERFHSNRLGDLGWKLYTTIKGENFEKQIIIGDNDECYDSSGDTWVSLTSPLPWTVEVHMGNACQNTLGDDAFDNMWIKYASEFLNTPDSTRCGRISQTVMRCLLPQRP